MLSRIEIKGTSDASPSSTTEQGIKAASARRKDNRGLKIAPADLEDFTNAVQQAFNVLARDYYLQGNVEPMVRVHKDALHITIPVIKQR